VADGIFKREVGLLGKALSKWKTITVAGVTNPALFTARLRGL